MDTSLWRFLFVVFMPIAAADGKQPLLRISGNSLLSGPEMALQCGL
ncbi:MAG: hypothetical protein KJ989_07510 [Gammaproteobacteria bacterium]|nr:hypothetical protein [Gammaproteobacteria bacterium]MBU2156955.1 hypothetical protein [Gammaproteobacteria bacterium]MBU2256696.1 hypothetical protein [Gammaproteobacteria bacterium]MBU2294037.1 hypothetical protein [Gammaproteobacteria bacterium]